MENKDRLFNQRKVSTSEEFLQTMTPPEHACAVSDKIGRDLDGFILNLCSARNLINEFDLSALSKEDYLKYVLEFDRFRDYVSDSIEKCSQFLDDTESIRSSCLNIRNSVRGLKFDFYNCLNQNLKFEFSQENISLLTYFPKSSFSEDFLTQQIKIEDFNFGVKIDNIPQEISGIEINLFIIGKIYLDLLIWANELSNKMIQKIQEK